MPYASRNPPSETTPERDVAVQNGDADLEFGDLTVEVPCHEPLFARHPAALRRMRR